MFNLEKAKKAGYSDEDIAMELSTKHKYDFARATEAGYSLDEINRELATKPLPDTSPEAMGAPVQGDLPIAGEVRPLESFQPQEEPLEQYPSDPYERQPAVVPPSEIVKAGKRGLLGVGEQMGKAIGYMGEEIEAADITPGAPEYMKPAIRLDPESFKGAGEEIQEFYRKGREKKELKMSPELAAKPWHDPKKFISIVTEALPLTVGGMGAGALATIATKNPYIGASITSAAFGTISAANTFEELTQAGVPEDEALMWSRTAGMGEGFIEILPGIMFMKLLKKTKLSNESLKEGGEVLAKSIEVAKSMGKLALVESLEEGAQTVKDNLIAQQAYQPERPILKDVPESMALGGAMGLGLGAGGRLVGGFETPPVEPITPEVAPEKALTKEERFAKMVAEPGVKTVPELVAERKELAEKEGLTLDELKNKLKTFKTKKEAKDWITTQEAITKPSEATKLYETYGQKGERTQEQAFDALWEDTRKKPIKKVSKEEFKKKMVEVIDKKLADLPIKKDIVPRGTKPVKKVTAKPLVISKDKKALQTKQYKKVWTKTKDEYIESEKGTVYKDSMGRETTWSGREEEVRTSGYYHKAMVERALNAGLQVPENVLKDYPKLAPAKESVVTGELPKKPLLGDEKGEVSLEGVEDIPTRAKKAVTAVKEFFTPFSTIPQAKAYEELRYRTLGKLDRVEQTISKIWKRTKDLPSEQKKGLFDFLAGSIEKTALPVKLQPMAVSLRTQHNLVGKMLVKRGLMTQETYEKNKDSYVKFMYLKHLEGGAKGGGRGLKLGLSYQKGRMDPTIKEVNGMYQVVSKGGHKYSKATLTKTGAEKKQKTVQSEVDEYRRSIGLVEDISVAAPTGLASTLSDITKFDFMKEMSVNPDWVWQDSIVKVDGKRMGIGRLDEEIKTQKSVVEQAPNVPEAQKRLETMESAMAEATAKTDKIPEDFVQLPVAKAYGDLSGAYIRKEIALDIQPVVRMFSDSTQFGKIVNAGIKAEEQLVAAFKVGKVALNPPTIARNILSNQIQLNMSGIPLHKIPVYWAKTAKAMKDKSQYYVEARRQGIFRTNWALTEIDEVLDTVKTMEKDGYAGVIGSIGKLAKFYGKIDDFFKLLKYIEQREGGATKGTASREAQKWVMDYSRATPSIKFARKHLLPMVTFQYKIMPLIAEAAVKRPWVIAKYLMIPYLMNEMAKQNLDIDDDEWKKLEKQLPEYVRDSGVYTLYPVRSPEGNLQWVNLEYYVPWQGIIGLNQMAKKGDYNEAVGDIVRHPILDVITSFKTAKGEDPPKDTFTGREIYNRLDTSNTKALKTAEWLTSKWAPSAFTRGGALHKSFRVGEKDRYGRTITKSQAAGKWVGFNIVAPTKKQAMLEKRRRLKAVDRAIFKVVIDPTNSKEYVKQIREAGKREKEKILEYYGKGD